MKRFFCICLAALLATAAFNSCDKENKPGKGKYGVDGVTPMPKAVDLGIEITRKDGTKYKLLWASFNIGASKEYEYGDYYAWGETEPYYSSLDPLQWKKRETDSEEMLYNWGSYSYTGAKINTLSKYCPKNQTSYWGGAADTPDGETTLLPEDDVAHKKLGGKWRMPTKEEFDALMALKKDSQNEGSDYVWEGWVNAKDSKGNEVTDLWGNTVGGIRITRKSTNATLFFPAAGGCQEDFVPGTAGTAGVRGTYWSSSVFANRPILAYHMTLYYYPSEDMPPSSYINNNPRFLGLPVRPVCEEEVNE